MDSDTVFIVILWLFYLMGSLLSAIDKELELAGELVKFAVFIAATVSLVFLA